MTLPARRSKYGNVRTVVDGLAFDSVREAARWEQLKLLHRAGAITELSRQVRIVLSVNGTKIGEIIPDFRYVENGKLIHEDTKSPATLTPMFRWKAKHALAEHGIKIRVVM